MAGIPTAVATATNKNTSIMIALLVCVTYLRFC